MESDECTCGLPVLLQFAAFTGACSCEGRCACRADDTPFHGKLGVWQGEEVRALMNHTLLRQLN